MTKNHESFSWDELGTGFAVRMLGRHCRFAAKHAVPPVAKRAIAFVEKLQTRHEARLPALHTSMLQKWAMAGTIGKPADEKPHTRFHDATGGLIFFAGFPFPLSQPGNLTVAPPAPEFSFMRERSPQRESSRHVLSTGKSPDKNAIAARTGIEVLSRKTGDTRMLSYRAPMMREPSQHFLPPPFHRRGGSTGHESQVSSNAFRQPATGDFRNSKLDAPHDTNVRGTSSFAGSHESIRRRQTEDALAFEVFARTFFFTSVSHRVKASKLDRIDFAPSYPVQIFPLPTSSNLDESRQGFFTLRNQTRSQDGRRRSQSFKGDVILDWNGNQAQFNFMSKAIPRFFASETGKKPLRRDEALRRDGFAFTEQSSPAMLENEAKPAKQHVYPSIINQIFTYLDSNAAGATVIDPRFFAGQMESYQKWRMSNSRAWSTPTQLHRTQPESRRYLQHLFSNTPVRIHSDARAGALAQALHAEAFTFGKDIFFAPGRFDLATPRGMALMSHELVHVRQNEDAAFVSARQKRAQPLAPVQHGEREREALAAEKMILTSLTIPEHTYQPQPMEFVVPPVAPAETGVMKAEEGRSMAPATPPSPAPMNGTFAPVPMTPTMDVEHVAHQVYQIIVRKLREEKAMRGD